MRKPIPIEGTVLLLVGPLGLFFSRVAGHLEAKGVSVYKVALPMREPGFRNKKKLIYNGPPCEFRSFIESTIDRYKVKHVLMYGDYIPIHREALIACRAKGVNTIVFELGYRRPGFITVEDQGVNSRSVLMNQNLREAATENRSDKSGIVLNQKRKRYRIAKVLTYILHSLTRYELMGYRHKLQPEPIDLWHQYWGYLSYYIYSVTETRTRKMITGKGKYFLVALQVAFDSQLRDEDRYNSMKAVIIDACKSFAEYCSDHEVALIFKHHPRDRGFNNYLRDIKAAAKVYGIS